MAISAPTHDQSRQSILERNSQICFQYIDFSASSAPYSYGYISIVSETLESDEECPVMVSNGIQSPLVLLDMQLCTQFNVYNYEAFGCEPTPHHKQNCWNGSNATRPPPPPPPAYFYYYDSSRSIKVSGENVQSFDHELISLHKYTRELHLNH